MPSRPIFVLGTSFSGSSILSWALAQHPHLVHALENPWLVRLAGELEPLLKAGTANPDRSSLVALSVDRTRFFEAFGSAVDSLLASNGSPAAGGRRWIDCTPANAQHVAGLVRLFPHARFIHVLRDVRSVVGLLVSRALSTGSLYTQQSAYEYWLGTSKAILEVELAFGPERVLRVSHASLLADPDAAIRACLRFIDEPYCEDCVRPFHGLGSAMPAPPVLETGRRAEWRIQREAELLSDLLLPRREPIPERIARLDAAFAKRSRRRQVQRASRPLVQRVQETARSVLPPQARVLVISKGDDELLKLGTRQASHFPQAENGVYAGFYPATSADAIAHLEALRKKGHDHLLVPGPYFWWLDHYRELAAHLHAKGRLVYYEEGNCAIFGFTRTPRGWSAGLTGRSGKPSGKGAAAPPAAPAARPAGAARAAAGTGTSADARGQPPRRRGSGASYGMRKLARKLWGGFSTYAAADLERLCRSDESPLADRVGAAWELARWSAVRDDFTSTLSFLERLRTLDESQRLAKRHVLLEVRARLRLGDVAPARALLAEALDRHGHDTDLCLLAATALASPPDRAGGLAAEEERLRWINRVFTSRGYRPIRRIDPALPLAIDNITCAGAEGVAPVDGPKVSVVVPAYNAEATIGFALAGLREQTWRNLEILVADDASTDGTRDVVATMAAADPRIQLITLEANAGAYVARNTGLARATGEYFTVHDADDWSHAQKIETQVAYLASHDVTGAISCWARASRSLQFNGSWLPHDKLLDPNYSSLMLPTETLRALGGWDPVRTGADAEFRERLETRDGKACLPIITTNVPWSFALDDEGSLTRQRPTHIRTIHFGLRREYHRLFERWHQAAAQSGDFTLPTDPKAKRKFPAPAPILAAANGAAEYDLVLVCDMAMVGGAFVSSYHYVLAALRQGLRVGLFHWRRYDLDEHRPIDERFAALIDAFKVDLLVPDQPVRTTHLVFNYPPTFRYRLDGVPAVAHDHMYVIVNQMSDRLYGGGDPQYDPLVVRENLEALFGSSGDWFPISPIVRQLMAADPRYPSPGEATWTPLLDTDAWCHSEPAWRGGARPTPVIGRHGRDHYTKWPQTREAIEQAYCVPMGWETRFLGGAEHAIKALGARPPHWQTWSFDGIGVREFLESLDFLVHFPHEDYIEEFGRVVMEAMALGIPVVLPSRFAGTFGDAAVYCEPDAVSRQIAELWADEQRYLERARVGRRFVLENCSFDQLRHRLRPRREAAAPAVDGRTPDGRYRDGLTSLAIAPAVAASR